MFYDLSSPIEIKAARSRFEFLIEKGKKIKLVEHRKKRTYKQNRYLHLLLGWFAVETGFTLGEAKQIYKLQSKDIYFYAKKDEVFIRSSADLNTKDLAITIERFRNYSNTVAGIYLPEANEVDFLNHIEENLENYENKVFI